MNLASELASELGRYVQAQVAWSAFGLGLGYVLWWMLAVWRDNEL
jgi:hypothetical protein